MTGRILVLLLCLFAAPWAAQAGAQERTVVFLGDSLTAGHGLAEGQAYPALVGRALPLGWRVVNAGVSGDTTAGALRRVPWILRSKPEVVFICIGANDGLRGMPLDALERNLVAIVTAVKAGGSRPMLAGMQLPTSMGEPYRADFSAIFPRVAQGCGVPLMPFLLAGVAAVPTLNQADGIHPNADGQALIAKQVVPFLAANGVP